MSVEEDTRITHALSEFLKGINKDFAAGSGKKVKRSFRLDFAYKGKPYTTILNVERTGKRLAVKNDCIEVILLFDEGKMDFSTEISANSVTKKCFDPVLESNARNKPEPRVTSADVLQILKTKINLAFGINDTPLNILDVARKDLISISPFNVLRGGNAFYEKYGYESDLLTGLKEKLKTFKWSECNGEIRSVIEECTGKGDWPSDIPLIEIMKTITWGDEKKYNADKSHKSLSRYVFEQFAKIVSSERTATGYIRPIWRLELNRDSSAWRRCNSELLFTAFTPDAAGGGRGKSRRTSKSTKNKSRKQRHHFI